MRPLHIPAVVILVFLFHAPAAAEHKPRPISQVRETGYFTGAWPIEKFWDAQAEVEWSAWINAIGLARELRSFRLSKGLKDPDINPLYTPDDDPLDIESDCANLPYIMRAYFAYKTRRPFSFVANKVRRYKEGNEPQEWSDWSQYASFQKLRHGLTAAVSSGSLRMHSRLEGTDTYPIEISPESVVPGTVYYDPNGHVLIVYKVDNFNGEIQMLDSHPDGTLTRKTWGPKYAVGSARFGGGFKRWRHYDVEVLDKAKGSFRITRKLNSESMFYSETAEYQWRYKLEGYDMLYHEWVKARISRNGIFVHPLEDFSLLLEAMCHDAVERVDAVQEAIRLGISLKKHPKELPYNIYGAEGEWEDYATPGRDARLRFSAKELRDMVARHMKLAQEKSGRLKYEGTPTQLAAEYLRIWDEHVASPECRVTYTNSKSWPITLTIADVFDRLFDLSFDPYHCIELRWGAPLKDANGNPTAEFATCQDDGNKLWWYKEEAQLRNRVTRLLNKGTATHRGPLKPWDVNVRTLLECYQQNQSDPLICHKWKDEPDLDPWR